MRFDDSCKKVPLKHSGFVSKMTGGISIAMLFVFLLPNGLCGQVPFVFLNATPIESKMLVGAEAGKKDDSHVYSARSLPTEYLMSEFKAKARVFWEPEVIFTVGQFQSGRSDCAKPFTPLQIEGSTMDFRYRPVFERNRR